MTPDPRSTSTGTLAWGAATAGGLGRRARLGILRDLAFVQTREAVDAARARLGLLRPAEVALDDLMPPETGLVRDARDLAQATHSEPLLLHSWRTFLFGAMLARHDRIDHDPALLFAAAILHDIGLTRGHQPPLCTRCFAVSGGERARDHLCAHGHPPATAHAVGDAISLHLNVWVSRRLHGAEAHLLSRGAFCDLFGIGRRRLPRATLDRVLTDYPRAGVIDALRFETADHMPGSRADFMTRLAGGKAPADPFAAPATG